MRSRLTTRQKMIAARAAQQPIMAVRRVFGRGPLVETTRKGVRWNLDLREGIDFAIWLRGCFEPSTLHALQRLVRPGATVLDIGANVGAHTLHLAAAVGPTGRVLAFEPVAESFRKLRANVAANPSLAGQVELHQMMLLADDGSDLPGEVLSSWPLLPREELAEVPGRALPTDGASARSLDSVLEDRDDVIQLVKLDVDGYECEVLDGARRTFATHRPVLVTEVAPFVYDDSGRSIDELLDRFDDLGYDLWSFREQRVTRAEIAELEQERASRNVIARPR